MITLLLVIIAISILILVHEWGHFYAARRLGVKVEEFGIGFPPRLLSTIRNGVRYSINALPFGGFVKIFGEQGEGEDSPESFISRPVWQRFIILAAGVGMNFVLAWVFFTGAAFAGLPDVQTGQGKDVPVSIIAVSPGSPAEAAGIHFGDEILELHAADISLRVETEDDVRNFIAAYRGEKITLVIRRGQEVKEVSAMPRVSAPNGEGPLGIAMARLVLVHIPWYQAPIEGSKMLARGVSATVSGFAFLIRDVFSKGVKNASVSGPVGIFFFARDTRSLGLSYFLQFVGMLSVNLGVLNFLPIPALDGGRIFFLVIEKIRGSRIRPSTEGMIHTAGFLLLILLIAAVTYNDIAKIL